MFIIIFLIAVYSPTFFMSQASVGSLGSVNSNFIIS